MDITHVFEIFAALVGFPALVATVINIGKALHWIPDGSAGNVNFIIQLLGVLAVGVAVYFGKDVGPYDQALGSVATIVLLVFQFLTGLPLAKLWHYLFSSAGVPLIGYSHSEF